MWKTALRWWSSSKFDITRILRNAQDLPNLSGKNKVSAYFVLIFYDLFWPLSVQWWCSRKITENTSSHFTHHCWQVYHGPTTDYIRLRHAPPWKKPPREMKSLPWWCWKPCISWYIGSLSFYIQWFLMCFIHVKCLVSHHQHITEKNKHLVIMGLNGSKFPSTLGQLKGDTRECSTCLEHISFQKPKATWAPKGFRFSHPNFHREVFRPEELGQILWCLVLGSSGRKIVG